MQSLGVSVDFLNRWSLLRLQPREVIVAKKIDFKKERKTLFQPPVGDFVEVDVPAMRFVMVDGNGDPNTVTSYREALEWLYTVSYAMKFAAKNEFDRDYVVPPLEGLWWAEDPADFILRNKDRWSWTMMILVPDFVTEEMFCTARDKAAQKLGSAPKTSRLASLAEGRCLQTMHIGSYDDEGPTLARLHDEIMPRSDLTFNGPHHEIYISDPRRVAPDRLKTVLRQPVRPSEM
ncbi:hypothetical protein CVM52_15085 [Pseudooceanicola lipolyticus]|uniref:GyrI-like small molecule binding domain-containing protein n=1 Tax=Pseudooceanicola lipolyticus TaxID=2029104 RepID=A0A2M8IZC0_9RHOB|nr:hypothetical protein CVM52_15085 [Pseudooceanicola lipolyticus]